MWNTDKPAKTGMYLVSGCWGGIDYVGTMYWTGTRWTDGDYLSVDFDAWQPLPEAYRPDAALQGESECECTTMRSPMSSSRNDAPNAQISGRSTAVDLIVSRTRQKGAGR